MERCFVCRQPVLGLIGQETLFDTYLLREEADDLRAAEAGAYGSCHFLCLAASPWRDFWVGRYTGYLLQSQFIEVGRCGTWSALRHAGLKEIAFAQSSTGWCLRYPEYEVRRAVTEAQDSGSRQGVQFAVGGAGSVLLDLRQMPEAAHAIRRSFSQNAAFPLRELLRLLGIADRMIYGDALVDGVLLPAPRRGKKALARQAAYPAEWVTIQWKYRIFLPAGAVNAYTDPADASKRNNGE